MNDLKTNDVTVKILKNVIDELDIMIEKLNCSGVNGTVKRDHLITYAIHHFYTETFPTLTDAV
ncbi:hypothetical protein [Bacillus sp. AFS075034]|uniref:hypothetical protein n=1 Tax=Bacillus sp. AFS075034 TaxID=2034281 RepID=UPI000BF6D5CA|nr:hypothetical protein [Bacillus sp. AFS075034]PFW61527.1 hypothetical protein COL20_16930 [Bacillus sp. AFS075034]